MARLPHAQGPAPTGAEPFVLLSMRLRHFDEPMDGIIYASIAALGFASHENLEYMDFLDGWPMVARAIVSPLTHAMFASIWGYAAGRIRSRGVAVAKPIVAGLLVSAALHGVYDFLAVGAAPLFRPVSAVIILLV